MSPSIVRAIIQSRPPAGTRATTAIISAYRKPTGPYAALNASLIAPGAHADLLAIGGDPTDDIAVLENPALIRLIVKGGRIHKNTLAS